MTQHITNLADYRATRAQSAAQAQAWRTLSKRINDHCTLYCIEHESRDVVQAGILFMLADVEAFGAGGWGEFNNPQRDGSVYVSCGMTVRFPEI